MLPKENRIKKKKDFEIIFKKGGSFKNSFLILRFMNNGLEQSRFGFVVSLKVSKKAVVRNKIKRRFAEIIKANKEKIRNGVDLVLIALPGTEKKDFSEVKNCVDEVFTKAKLIKNNV